MTSGDKQALIGQYTGGERHDPSTLPATEHEVITGRSVVKEYVLTEFPEPPKPNPRAMAHGHAVLLDGAALELNNATLRYETSRNYSEKYRKQIVDEILGSVAKISQHARNIAEVIRACEVSDELGVETALREGGQ